MTKELTSRQVSVILFLGIISLKLIILPSFLYLLAKNNSYICFILNLISDFLSLFAFLWFMKRNPDMTFKDLLEQSLGKIICKIVFLLLGCYFFIKTLMTLKELQNYFNRVLFDDFAWLKYIAPTLILLFYLITKPFKTFGRCAELLYVFVLFSAFLIIILSYRNADIVELFPFLQDGLKPIFKGVFRSTFAFGDYLILFLFLGKIKFSKSGKRTMIIYPVISIIFVVMFFLIYIATFGGYCLNTNLAISDLSLNFVTPLTVGRLDWINILVWSFLLLFNASLLLTATSECFYITTSIKRKIFISLFNIIMVFVILSFEKLSLNMLLNFISSSPFVYFAIVVQMGFPLLLIIGNFIIKHKNKKLNKNKIIFKTQSFELENIKMGEGGGKLN